MMFLYHPVVLILLAATSGNAAGTSGQPKKPNLDCKAKGKQYQLVCFDKSKLFMPNVAVIAPITDPKTKAIVCPRPDKVLSACCDISRLDGQTMGGSGYELMRQKVRLQFAGACPGFKFHF
ncbi:hypothetical protein PGT21_030072 [Puccinia graminis f. sp. tritici]|uniref:Uncharacterized protein n=2 Tax=Puccinia graminis f. sp. tritici TaxID=56615 RepID=H6QRU8_PUCGT|nr:hypothetical protein, variant [Puccinia graminis f. sp. tritici CRL 75-36-700-3]EHS63390.1 hypothetical protein, variant [Puccinia graminis f. sp. tritici CRL 75-36-700-3]KAA1078178.1 hypothetical protein PGT21_030072 [Puccinia graminis f. sp. tritici]